MSTAFPPSASAGACTRQNTSFPPETTYQVALQRDRFLLCGSRLCWLLACKGLLQLGGEHLALLVLLLVAQGFADKPECLRVGGDLLRVHLVVGGPRLQRRGDLELHLRDQERLLPTDLLDRVLDRLPLLVRPVQLLLGCIAVEEEAV